MPLLPTPGYRPPWIFRNRHIHSMYPSLFRKITDVPYQRERIHTPDGDFLDLDWSAQGSDKLVLVLHGLEGDSQRPYTRGMIRAFRQIDWDGAGFNFRGCSGEPNLKPYSYHMAATADVDLAVRHILQTRAYREILLVGFSLGGNVTLRYVAEYADRLPPALQKAIAFSAPCDIPGANQALSLWYNRPYIEFFMLHLNRKFREKARRFPGMVRWDKKRMPRNFTEFDNAYTAPLHGFADAHDYWTRASSRPLLPQIRIPTLIVNAHDDSFLSPSCYPVEEARSMPNLFLEIPRFGGHVGFIQSGPRYWSEQRALDFALKSC